MTGARKLVDGARTVVFDLDGTLVDTLGDLWTALNTALAQHDLPGAPREAVLANVHLGLEGTVRAVLSDFGVEASRNQAIARSYEAAYRARDHAASTLYPGVRDFLAACARDGRAMAVCTNKAAGDARDLLSLLQIADFFQVVTGIDTCGFAKPHPAPLISTLERLRCAAEESVFIGDSVVDARCAANAQVAFLLHESGYGAGDAVAFGCEGRFRSYGELVHETAVGPRDNRSRS
jgi:phosphoglycolate phosphatase